MLRSRLGILSLVGATLIVVVGGIVVGYQVCGYDWTYKANPMGENYLVNPNTADCPGELASVQAPAATWNNTGTDFAFTYGGQTSATDYGNNGYNEIMWVNYDTESIATAYMWVSGGTDIVEADIVFNDLVYTWSSSGESGKMDVQNSATHEFGHWLCLGDLYDPGDSEKTMYAYSSLGETKKRSLHSDDIAGIQAIEKSDHFFDATVGESRPINVGEITVRLVW